MTITGEVTHMNKTATNQYRGTFADLPDAVNYNQAGKLKPSKWMLEVRTGVENTIGANVRSYTSYSLNLYAVNDYNIGFTANYSHPRAGKIPDYDYGHGAAELLKDASLEILEFISKETGVDLVSVVQEALLTSAAK